VFDISYLAVVLVFIILPLLWLEVGESWKQSRLRSGIHLGAKEPCLPAMYPLRGDGGGGRQTSQSFWQEPTLTKQSV